MIKTIVMTDYHQKSINAVFYANPEKLQEYIDEGNFPKELLTDIGLLSQPFPIWRIPQCWEEAMGDNASEYTEKDVVADFMARNKKVKEIFQNLFGVEYTPIDYQSYWKDYFAAEPDKTAEDALYPDTIETLATYGTTQLDVELYLAVEKFDYSQTIELLKKGANPRATMSNDEFDEGAYDRISSECSYLCTCRLSYAWSPKGHTLVGENEIQDLVGWAAHEKMYRCLVMFNTVQETLSCRHPRNSIGEMIVERNKWDSSLLSGMKVIRAKDLSIEIDGPDDGWLDITFNVKGEKPFCIEVSDVYPPFPNLRAWMEDLLNYREVPSKSIIIDCERYHVILSYDYLGGKETENGIIDVALIQLQDDIEYENLRGEHGKPIRFVVPVYWLVSLLYNTLKDYIYANRRVFSKYWSLPNCGYFEFRKFIRSMESKKIEERLKQ